MGEIRVEPERKYWKPGPTEDASVYDLHNNKTDRNFMGTLYIIQ
jgi:hypothetical protein